ncbi:hypothetical protein CPB83DRAFT_849115 [Crepidotus variabilis]|uniref:Uncharacterized protein n=1 Tax=Crepidotus variabilis TaxID=179855 RepID=A0A9P6EMB8_9AGAR|nr:hypothetical protein CPB83DRAFT_849115 [Crepidotus variabilis]
MYEFSLFLVLRAIRRTLSSLPSFLCLAISHRASNNRNLSPEGSSREGSKRLAVFLPTPEPQQRVADKSQHVFDDYDMPFLVASNSSLLVV